MRIRKTIYRVFKKGLLWFGKRVDYTYGSTVYGYYTHPHGSSYDAMKAAEKLKGKS